MKERGGEGKGDMGRGGRREGDGIDRVGESNGEMEEDVKGNNSPKDTRSKRESYGDYTNLFCKTLLYPDPCQLGAAQT